jgi:sigma54-dependent transcription regulator
VTNENSPEKDKFLFPQSRYYGNFTPENLAFNANLQEFAQRVAFICGLETGGKISSKEAYDEIRRLWKVLKRSKNELLDAPKPPPPELPQDE